MTGIVEAIGNAVNVGLAHDWATMGVSIADVSLNKSHTKPLF